MTQESWLGSAGQRPLLPKSEWELFAGAHDSACDSSERQPHRYSSPSIVTSSIAHRHRNKQIGDPGQGYGLKLSQHAWCREHVGIPQPVEA